MKTVKSNSNFEGTELKNAQSILTTLSVFKNLKQSGNLNTKSLHHLDKLTQLSRLHKNFKKHR